MGDGDRIFNCDRNIFSISYYPSWGVTQVDLLELQAFVTNLADWCGTLEDAAVISTALRYRCPVWTMNYRDFGAFDELEFWTPDST